MQRKALRGIVYLAFLVLSTGALFEVGIRVLLSFRVGSEVLWYGTTRCCGPRSQMQFDRVGGLATLQSESHTVMQHENELEGYSKYGANQERVDYDVYGVQFSVRINSHGFRGRDFEVSKLDDVTRVVTLGASSTFGYHDRDDETYPFYLERNLNARLAGAVCEVGSFEVINLGIPHLMSSEILALFRSEAIPLEPDFVTFYEGVNDSADSSRLDFGNPWHDVPLYYRFVRKLRRSVLTFALIDNLLTIHMKHFSGEDLLTHLEGKSERFLSNLEAIRREAEGVGAELVVANQQARSMLLNDVEVQGKTYADELLTVKAKLEEEGWLGRLELFFLTHAVLMDDLREWAEESDVPFVDAIGATDSRRDLLVSWVHLKPEGNQVISEAFADVVFTRACRQ